MKWLIQSKFKQMMKQIKIFQRLFEKQPHSVIRLLFCVKEHLIRALLRRTTAVTVNPYK